MLFDIHRLCWDQKLLDLLNIPQSMLPQVLPSGSFFGNTTLNGAEIPITGIAGDQQSALFGQGCFNDGDIKNTYGTGCFLLANTGNRPVFSDNGLLTTLAATLEGEKTEYALEGSVFVGGAVVQWLRDELKFIEKASDSEAVAMSVSDSGGVYVVPAFSGLGAPYWDMDARGTITGITRGTGKAHIVRAALESIAFQTDDLIRAMEADMGRRLTALKVDGGASENRFLMQFQADISGLDVVRASTAEATALGAALIAGLTVGYYRDRASVSEMLSSAAAFSPGMDADRRAELLTGWKCAVASCRFRG